MTCICCLSDIIEPDPLGFDSYKRCRKCHAIFSSNGTYENFLEKVSSHYLLQDPHKSVSHSKKRFFIFVLDYLSSKVQGKRKKILDVGCGYGYFLDQASKSGWEPNGIEVVQDAVKICSEKFGYKNIYKGEIKEARLPRKSFDAITLWDVLAIVDNPYHELEECNRLLKKGGTIGIRTRNVLFQTFIYRVFHLIKRFAVRISLKEPYVFHRFCFSSKSIHALLTRAGFINIEILNSPLTSGDPYEHMGIHFPVKLAKYFLHIISKFIYWISSGRLLIGPSLLIWAEKP